ncbi:MAG TPA: CPBP family intramembrane glutamic endopeptidase [Candidatus Limnocylindria bacterium]|nr:CPBP family intramembrane glutamic endopeptidase [Candidatus Limnocylindria bacterium]
MTSEPEAAGSAAPVGQTIQAETKPDGIRSIFVGPDGIRAGWRFLMFLALFIGLQYIIVQRGLRLIPGFVEIVRQTQSGGVLTPEFSLISESALLAITLLATWIMGRIEKRPFGTYGIPLQGAFGKLFWQGAAWGLAFETVEILAIYAFGGFSFGTVALAGPTLVKYAIVWAIAFILVGLFEESLFRGYSQYTLGSGIGFWPAAAIISGLFGATHLSNPGEGWVGALSVFAFGIFGCLALRRTGNLWFIVGFHAAGDYAETFIYSTPDSGLLAQGHLLNSSFHGPRWLTGGTIGPEGSVFDFVVFVIAFALFNWAYPAKQRSQPS